MATYKVIQDIEAEDKLVGPLSLRQFIYAGITALCCYLGFLSVTKGAAFMLVVFVPIAGLCGFFAFPFKQDQPTEVWALARVRFLFKPRNRIWDQSGQKDLVTITVPRKVETRLTDGLNQDEVHSRLEVLASTLDSRGWAVKNVNVNLVGTTPVADTSDRLVAASSLPLPVSDVDIRAADDILDEAANPIAQQFNTMISAAESAHRQQLLAQMQQPAGAPQPTPANDWFVGAPTRSTSTPATPVGARVMTPVGIPQAATPTAEEEAMVPHFKAENSSLSPAYSHMKIVKTPEQLAAEAAEEARKKAEAAAKPAVTPTNQAAIMNLANNDDLDVATLARQAKKQAEDGEIVISLH